MPRDRAFLAPAVAAAALMSSAGHSLAQNVQAWAHEESRGIHYAYYGTTNAELSVSCKGSAIEIFFYVSEQSLDPALKGRANAVFAVTIDDSQEILWKAAGLVGEPGVVSIGFGGKVADDLARDFAAAQRGIDVSILTTPPQDNTVPYNRVMVPTYGAADAIKAAYAGCGIKF